MFRVHKSECKKDVKHFKTKNSLKYKKKKKIATVIFSRVKIVYFFRARLVFHDHGCLYNENNGVTVPFTVYPFVKN